jgi:hypothetical protein
LIQVKDFSSLFVYGYFIGKCSTHLISEPGKAMHTLTHLKERLQQLEKEIAETKRRLPAHSVKPPVMMDLLALEDEYEILLAVITDLSKNRGNTV